MATAAERFWAKVDKAGPVPQHAPELGPCWLWTGTPGGDYGVFCPVATVADRLQVPAHRFAYELVYGPLSDELHAHHVCEVKRCVNPRHLQALTPGEHAQAHADAAEQTHCPHGHEFTPENTRGSGRGRFCRACDRERKQERRADSAFRDRERQRESEYRRRRDSDPVLCEANRKYHREHKRRKRAAEKTA